MREVKASPSRWSSQHWDRPRLSCEGAPLAQAVWTYRTQHSLANTVAIMGPSWE